MNVLILKQCRQLTLSVCIGLLGSACANYSHHNAATDPPLPTQLTLAVQSANPADTRAAWQPLVADMSKKLGINIALTTPSQTDTVAALGNRQADIVWLSSSAAIDAAANSDAQAFAVYENVNGTKGYKAVIATRADSGIKTLNDALTPDKYSYGMGAVTSTSGYVLPQHFVFTPRNTTANALFKSVTVAGHFPNLDSLWAKKLDVIVNNTTDLAVFQARTPGAQAGIITLWESPLVPNDVLMVRAQTSANLKSKLKTFFLNYGADAAEKVLLAKASGIRVFLPADNRLLEPVSGFKFGTERSAIAADAKLTAAEKAARLESLDAKTKRFQASLLQTN